MKFLLDENIGKKLAYLLTHLGHTAFRIKEISPGAEDFQVLKLAVEKDAILITLDKDYGELVFKEGKIHKGVIFLRLVNQTTSRVAKVLFWFLSKYPEEKIVNNFTVLTEKDGKLRIRFRKKKVKLLLPQLNLKISPKNFWIRPEF